jgi:hypothetical protein
MSIGPFDPTAGDYGSLNYQDPFGDTTADIGKPTVPAKVSGGNVGISPITMQGAVSIPSEEDKPFNFLDAASAINQSGLKAYDYYSDRSNFDFGNRALGNTSAGDTAIGKTVSQYVDLFSNNQEAPPLVKQVNGETYVLKLPDLEGVGNAIVPTLRSIYGQEVTQGLRDMDWTGNPEAGEYYKLEEKSKDALDYAGDLAVVAMSIANPAMGAFAAGSKTAAAGGDLGDIAKSAAGAYLGGQAGAGNGMFAGVGNAVTSNATLASAISAGTASGVATAVQGGDLGDVVKSGLLGGAGGAISSLGQEAAALEQAAQTAGAAGDFSNSVALTMQANELASQANLISTITNSAKAVDAITSGDYASALASGMQAAGTNLTEFTSNQLTGMFGEEAFANLNIDDVAAGVNKVATSLAEGKDIEEALQKGVTTYVQQGGSLGEAGDQVRDYLESAGGALYDKVIKPAGDMLTGLVDNVSSFDTPEGIEAIEDAVKQAGAVVDDSVLQPIKEGAESIYEPLSGPDVSLPTVDVNLPDVNLPDVNVDLPSMDLSGMFDGLMSYLPSQRTRPAAQQQTTAPVVADLSDLYIQQAEPEELLATRDYLSGLLRTI